MKKIKIILLVSSLMGGGAEKVMVNISKYLNRDMFDITLVCFKYKGDYINQLPKDIKVVDLGVQRVSRGLVPLIKTINNIKPEIIFSTGFVSNIVLIISKFFSKENFKIIIRETSLPTYSLQKNKLLYKKMYKCIYNQSDGIICQSLAMKEDLINNFSIKSNLTTIIRNPIDFEYINEKSNEYSARFNNELINIVCMGRLSSVKNHADLIKSFHGKYNNNERYHLHLIGEGPLKSELEMLVDELDFKKRIHFWGFQSNPYPLICNADLFVLSSKYEGLPNALLEAISCNIPIIVLNHPGGTKEIMELVGLENRFVDKLDWQDWWYQKLPLVTKDKLKDNFDKKRILREYEELFISTLNKERY